MQFDDHEIWGAPVQVPDAAPEPAAAPTAAPVTAGRLYRSAGSEPHADAVVALPNRKPKASDPLPSAAPITINSRIARPAIIDDAAIAEVLATPASTPTPAPSGFTSWFRQSSATPKPEASEGTAVPAPGVAAQQRAADAMAGAVALASNFGGRLDAKRFGLLALIVTTIAALVNAVMTGSLGMVTGIALVLVTIAGALRLDSASRWAAWVMPSYVLIGAVLLSGHFVEGAPGFSVLGNAMLVMASLITLAPWLALATVAGVLVPAVRGRRG